MVWGWGIYLKLDLKLGQCQGLQTPDEREEALGEDVGYWWL